MKRNKELEEKLFSGKGLEMLREVLDMYVKEEFDEYDELEDYEFSDNFKRNMNKIFRDIIGIDKIPHPEVEED